MSHVYQIIAVRPNKSERLVAVRSAPNAKTAVEDWKEQTAPPLENWYKAVKVG